MTRSVYKSETCLWKINSAEYRDRDLKHTAYLKLVTKLQEVEPASTKKTVVTRINGMRSNYRKELKKKRASMRTGSGADEVYTPTLCYFNDLNFLDDQETPRTSRTNIGNDDNETVVAVCKENFFLRILYFKKVHIVYILYNVHKYKF